MFIARQPIFNSILEVYGYELLYRSSKEKESFDGKSGLSATATVLSTSFEDGINKVADGKKAFINFDENFIKNYDPELLPPNDLVIEILEDVEIDQDLIDRIVELKEMGYKIALDDFDKNYNEYPLSKYADIIKYDLTITPLDKLEALIKVPIMNKKILLAEKIETEQEFLRAKKMGFHLFQGYFFSKPKIIAKSLHKNESKVQYVMILNELRKEEPSYQKIAEIIEKDVNLAYRLIKVISGRAGNDIIDSIKRALTYLGLNEIERWVSLMMVQEFGKNKPKELMNVSLIRSKFAESVSKMCTPNKKKFEASMMGLFSTIDALLDQTIEEALQDLAIPESIKDALINDEGELKFIYDLMMSYEVGDWENVDQMLKDIDTEEKVVTDFYIDAIKWSKELMSKM